MPHTTLFFNSWPGSNALCGLSSRSGKPLENEKTSSDRRLDRLREMEEQALRAEDKAEGCTCIICRDRNKRARVEQLSNENERFAEEVLELSEDDVQQ